MNKTVESTFDIDLSKEGELGKLLDVIYPTIPNFAGWTIERISDKEQQHRGIDLIISKGEKVFYIDEKAQLDYIGRELPTFTFEISYLNKHNEEKLGWFLDRSKVTNAYYLITNISFNNPSDIKEGLKTCKILSVDRQKLLNFLVSIGLTGEVILEMNNKIRTGKAIEKEEEKIEANGLHFYSEGRFHYSKGKKEKPINLTLGLLFLIEKGIAKVIYEKK